MPYRLDPDDRRCVQVKRGDRWERVEGGCHDTVAQAKRHRDALRINVEEAEFELAEFDSSVPPRSRRKLGDALNQVLMDALLRHRHYVLMAENGIVRDALQPIRDAERRIRSALASVAGGADALEDLSRLSSSALRDLEREFRAAAASAELRTGRVVSNALSDFARAESRIQTNILRIHTPDAVPLDTGELPSSRIAAIVDAPYKGGRWRERLARNAAEAADEAVSAVRAARATGRSAATATSRIRLRFKDVLADRAVATIRTEAQRVANEMLLDSYRRNSQTVKAVQIVETLDDLTCLICAARDGMVLDPRASNPEAFPPYHPNCRGFASPVLASWQEMGLNAEDLSPETRPTLDGRVPGTVTYRDWFEDQPRSFKRRVLGPTRFRRYEEDGLTIRDFTDAKNLRILRIAELPEAA